MPQQSGEYIYFLPKSTNRIEGKSQPGWFGGQEGNKSTCFSGTEKQHTQKKIGKYHQQKIVATPKAYSIVSNRGTQTHTYTKATWKSIDICVKIKYIYRKTWQTTCGIPPPPPNLLHCINFHRHRGFPIFRLPALLGRNAARMWGCGCVCASSDAIKSRADDVDSPRSKTELNEKLTEFSHSAGNNNSDGIES